MLLGPDVAQSRVHSWAAALVASPGLDHVDPPDGDKQTVAPGWRLGVEGQVAEEATALAGQSSCGGDGGRVVVVVGVVVLTGAAEHGVLGWCLVHHFLLGRTVFLLGKETEETDRIVNRESKNGHKVDNFFLLLLVKYW